MDLRRNPMHDPTFDLSHLQAIHRRLFEDVYPFAGELRYVDMQKPGQTGDPFVHHGFAETYAAVVADQLHQEDDLAHLSDPGRWADRAAYFVAQMLHTHPFREGNGRAIRLWTTELAAAAGHELDWTRVDAPRNDAAARAAGGGDLEPMRYLLGHVAGATIGVDRPINALDALDDGLRAAAWKRTGLVHGDPADREWLLEADRPPGCRRRAGPRPPLPAARTSPHHRAARHHPLGRLRPLRRPTPRRRRRGLAQARRRVRQGRRRRGKRGRHLPGAGDPTTRCRTG